MLQHMLYHKVAVDMPAEVEGFLKHIANEESEVIRWKVLNQPLQDAAAIPVACKC
jgi:hypothetical protein